MLTGDEDSVYLHTKLPASYHFTPLRIRERLHTIGTIATISTLHD